jgi:aromatic ring-opening dioxygenase LigB subunit
MPGGHRGDTPFVPQGKALPLALGIGAELLDEAGYAGPRALESVDAAATAQECARAGARVAGLAPRVALLVVGDGSARRTPAAPGYFDERAEAFDASAETAVRAGDMAALAALDAGLAAELMATGRAAWQVLAGAAGLERRAPGEVLYSDAPFGVSYLVAVLDVQ